MYLVNVLALFYQDVLAHFNTICLPVKHGGTGRWKCANGDGSIGTLLPPATKSSYPTYLLQMISQPTSKWWYCLSHIHSELTVSNNLLLGTGGVLQTPTGSEQGGVFRFPRVQWVILFPFLGKIAQKSGLFKECEPKRDSKQDYVIGMGPPVPTQPPRLFQHSHWYFLGLNPK